MLSGRSFIKIQYRSFPLFPVAYPFRIATQLQYYVMRKKCKINDVILSSGCEVRAINLGNKNMKIGIFTGGTSVRSKIIFTDISRYCTGKHEIMLLFFFSADCLGMDENCDGELLHIFYSHNTVLTLYSIDTHFDAL